ncbi:hypothetical protein [Bandra megavirus]|uniref:Uncharacterized protein n=1 Tax=Bandra megavirus TaxID=2071566 RepID=A0A2K9V7Y4_9VIRU|nr:hypothetical protein [Bandra megavirus]
MNTNNKSISQKIFSEPLSQSEMDLAILHVLDRFGGSENDWYTIQESEDFANDTRLIENGCKPGFSDTYRNYPRPIQKANKSDLYFPMPLPDPIALVSEWQNEDKNWQSVVVAIMKTIQDFWKVMHHLHDDASASCRFALPLTGKENDANKMFSQLISSGRSINDQIIIDKSLQRRINNIVANYNSLHPVWSFVKVSDLNNTKDIEVPFIRKNCRAINDINVNLKDTKNNNSKDIYPMDNTFTKGYIPYLIFDLVRGQLPADVSAIVFNKTIAVNGNSYFKGFRVRVLTKTDETNSLIKCKNYLETHFLESHSTDNKDYSECVVRISLPK